MRTITTTGHRRILPYAADANLLDADTVRVVFAVPPEGITFAGRKTQFAPAGSPEQLNETGDANPFAGVTDTVVLALAPDATLSVAGFRAREKSGPTMGVKTIRRGWPCQASKLDM